MSAICLPPALQRAYQALLVDEVRASMRHGLRNKLGAIRNAAYFVRGRLARAGAPELPRVARCLDVIEREVRDASDLLDEPLEDEAPVGADEDAAAIAAALLDAVGSDAALEVVGPARVATARVELELALYCLLDNAYDAVDQEAARVRVRVEGGPGAVRVEVQDEGAGLSPELRLTACEPFVTTRPGRLGLGLAIARRIARTRGGALVLEAREQGGTVAVLELPAARTEVA